MVPRPQDAENKNTVQVSCGENPQRTLQEIPSVPSMVAAVQKEMTSFPAAGGVQALAARFRRFWQPEFR